MSHVSLLTKFRNAQKYAAKNGWFKAGKLFINMSGWYSAGGKVVGTDVFGNVYREAEEHPVNGRHRWVEFKDLDDFDSSEVPAEWHSWLNRFTDVVPADKVAGEAKTGEIPWKIEHSKNRGSIYGQDARYLPPMHWQREEEYEATKAKAWRPDQNQK